jgi:hypothetical protein
VNGGDSFGFAGDPRSENQQNQRLLQIGIGNKINPIATKHSVQQRK